MKNNDLLTVMNTLLVNKLTAVNQFMVHSEMCDNLGYSNLHEDIRKLALDQMRLAEKLIERISFLDGSSSLSNLNSIMIGKTVSEVISRNNSDADEAIRTCKDAIKLADEADDQDTAELLEEILMMEKGYIEWAEVQHTQIDEMGLEDYLVNQSAVLAN